MRRIIIAALGWLALCGAASAQVNGKVSATPGTTGVAEMPFQLQLDQSLSFANALTFQPYGQILSFGSITGGSGYATGNIPITLGAITAGSLYVTGQYNGVATTGGAGTGLTLNVTVGGTGTVIAAGIATAGTGYLLNDAISVSNTLLGGAGSGFSIPVATVGYTGIPLTGGNGSGAIASISVLAGAVNAVFISNRGTDYFINNALSAAAAGIGGSGSGFSVPVATVAGTQNASSAWLWENGKSILGGPVLAGGSGIIAPYQIYIGSDTVDTANTNLIAFSVLHASSGSGLTGGRIAIQGSEAVVGTPAALSAAGFVAVQGLTRVSANLTGTTGVFTNYKGTTFASNFDIFTTSGATFVGLVTAQENDVSVVAGSSTAEKHALSLVQGSNDANRGVYDDNAMQISSQDGTTTTWKTGIMFGGYSHKWSFGADSTLISAQVRTIGGASPSIALNGVDWTNVTFQSGGCAYKTTGYCIDPSGNVLLSSGVMLEWNTDTFIGRGSAAQVMLGGAPSATPVAQILSGQSVLAGTSNTTGGALTIASGQGTGTGAGGVINFDISLGATSGSTVNPLVGIMSLTSGQQILLGTNPAFHTVRNNTLNPTFQFHGNLAAVDNALAIFSFRNSATIPAAIWLSQSNSNTLGAQVAVASGTALGQVITEGSDGTNFQDSSTISMEVDAAVSAGIVPGRIRLLTANASGALTEALKIDSAQSIFVSVSTADTASTDATVCRRTSNGQLLTGTGTLGICLGTSGRQYKNNIADLEVGLDQIMALHPRQFFLNEGHGDPSKLMYGFIADEALKALPKLVGYDTDGVPNTFDYLGIVPPLVAAVQSLERRLASIEQRVNQ